MNTHNFYHQRQWYIFWEESWSSCTPWAFLLVLCLSQKRSEVFKMESWCDFSIPSSSVLHVFAITSAAWSCPPVTRMTSTYPTWTTWHAAPHLYVTSPRSPHSETGRCVTSILRSGERRTKNFCGLSTVSVLSYVIYFNAQEELIFFYLFIAPQGLFCVSFL